MKLEIPAMGMAHPLQRTKFLLEATHRTPKTDKLLKALTIFGHGHDVVNAVHNAYLRGQQSVVLNTVICSIKAVYPKNLKKRKKS